MIAKSVDVFGTDWDEYLHHLLFVYHTKPHDSKPAKSLQQAFPTKDFSRMRLRHGLHASGANWQKPQALKALL